MLQSADMRKLLFTHTPESNFLTEIAVTALRVYCGLALALAHGWSKVPPSERFLEGVEELGFPMPVVFGWAAGLSELIGGLFLAAGFLTRPSALFVAFTMMVAAFGRHAADPFKAKELSLFYLFVALIFVCRGAGRISVDRILGR